MFRKVKVADVKKDALVRDFPQDLSGRCEIEAFLPDFLQNVKGEDVNTKLSCEISLKK